MIHILLVELQNGHNAVAAFTTKEAATANLVAVIRKRWNWFAGENEPMPETDDELIAAYAEAIELGLDDSFWIIEVELDASLQFDE